MNWLGNICMAAGVIMIFLKQLLGFIVFMVIAIILWGKSSNAGKKIKELLSDNIITSVIKEVLGKEAEYNPNGKITPGKMLFSFGYTTYAGSDHIKTVYNGLNIELSDIQLIEVVESADENGHTSRDEVYHFFGQWLTCDFGKELAGEVYISKWVDKKEKKQMPSNVNMDNEQFSDRFCVRADNPQEAYYILTPHMMEYITAMADQCGSAVYMSFQRDGKMNVAVRTGRDFFELGKSEADVKVLRQKYVDELRWFTDIVDTLRIEENLYKKEANL